MTRDEQRESLGKLWEKHGKPKCPCKVCGGTPDFVTERTDYSRWDYIECSCGVKVPFYGRSYLEACELWEKVNSESFTPKYELHYIGKPDACYTCLMRNTCTLCAGMDRSELLEHRCLEYIKEPEREK